MYRTILVPLDGSAFSEHALAPALTLARRSGAALRLVVVYARLVRPLDLPRAVTYDSRFDTEQLRDRETYLEGVKQRLSAEEGVEVSGVVLDEPDPSRAILGEARRAGADLIVMTTHGRGGISRAWMGSTADEILRESTVPLLLVRPAEGLAPETSAMRWNFAHVLVPLDGSELAEQVLEPALVFLRLTGARLTLLRVVRTPETLLPPEETFWTPAEQQMLDEGRAVAVVYLDDVAARLRGEGVQVETAVVLEPEPARAILRWGAEHQVDAIAICTHARAGLERLLIGSVTDKVVRGTTVPTLVVRPRS